MLDRLRLMDRRIDVLAPTLAELLDQMACDPERQVRIVIRFAQAHDLGRDLFDLAFGLLPLGPADTGESGERDQSKPALGAAMNSAFAADMASL